MLAHFISMYYLYIIEINNKQLKNYNYKNSEKKLSCSIST